MIITIKTVKDDGAKIGVEATTGKWYSAFKEINKGPNPALPALKVGITADFDIKDSPDGKFHNIIGAANISQAPPAACPAGQAAQIGYQGRTGSTNDSIEAQVAFKGMVELINAGKVTDEKAIKTVLAWAARRLDERKASPAKDLGLEDDLPY